MYFESEKTNKQTALLRIFFLGTLGFILLIFLSIKSVIPSIEKDILNNISTSLFEQKLSNIVVSVKGQEVTLEGLVTEKVKNQAIQIAQQVPGVNTVNSNFTIINSTPKTKRAP